MSNQIILSYFQAEAILDARGRGADTVKTSTDLGRTETIGVLDNTGVIFTSGESLTYECLKKIRKSLKACFLVKDSSIYPVRIFSNTFYRSYNLIPTKTAPALLNCGFLMHRIKGTDPLSSAYGMADALLPVSGKVLDTATGLGYSAIRASKTAGQVISIEIDNAVREIARLNPWSEDLFDNSKITLMTGDCSQVIETFKDKLFQAIIHDPPAFDLAGELYSGVFYSQAFRVLSAHGKMFHYIGDPTSITGARVTKGVLRRLKEAGFSRLIQKPEMFGVLAIK